MPLLPGFERAAASDAPVLFLGEGGTGRSSLGRLLHAASRRSDGPLIEVDPGAFPSGLFESELFGHRAGAFTGATTAASGRVARAESGSLLFDRVEDLPLAAQPKLLRLLAERRYVPLGGEERIADVRFIAVAGDDLPLRVERGAFRRDLFHRLEVLAFRVPALRERVSELPTLLEELLADLGERFKRPGLALSERAREWMLGYRWPGNLRELRNTLERSAVMSSEPLLDPEPPAGAASERPRPLRDVEAEEIRRALAYTRGRQAAAAALLGISRKALWEKRRRLGLP
ncbi:MAG: sigma 54-interacting transcriptional regulator [Acidobacteriota bacterium]